MSLLIKKYTEDNTVIDDVIERTVAEVNEFIALLRSPMDARVVMDLVAENIKNFFFSETKVRYHTKIQEDVYLNYSNPDTSKYRVSVYARAFESVDCCLETNSGDRFRVVLDSKMSGPFSMEIGKFVDYSQTEIIFEPGIAFGIGSLSGVSSSQGSTCYRLCNWLDKESETSDNNLFSTPAVANRDKYPLVEVSPYQALVYVDRLLNAVLGVERIKSELQSRGD